MKELARIIGIACQTTGITEEEFYNKKTYLATKARTFVYRHLEEKGMYHQQIAKLVGRSRSTVTCHLNGFQYDCKYDKRLRQMYERFKKQTE